MIVDYRERDKEVIEQLKKLGCEVKIEALKVADFILSENAAVELKSVDDFLTSIIDKRLLNQVKNMKENFQKSLLIVEGEENIYSLRDIHQNAIRGMITSLMLDFGIPILFTKDCSETAQMMFVIAKREQEGVEREFNGRGERKPLTTKELQEYIVTALPGVGPKIAKNMFEKFKTVQNVMNSSEKELSEVEKIGKIKAKKIREIVEEEYK